MKTAQLLLIFCIAIISESLHGQSPADLNSDILPSNGFNAVGDIEATFNNARRQEEIQLSLAANVIKDLDLPDQATWDAMSHDEQALFILNDERTSRAGIDYGAGPVNGLPFEGVGVSIDAAAQGHSDDMLSNNFFDHCNPSPTNCSENRIIAAVGNSCIENGLTAENIYAAFTSQIGFNFPNAVAQAIYNWNYEDSFHNWGHRRKNLNQNMIDNYGDIGKIGVIGFGVAIGGPYLGFNSGVTVTLDCFDPAIGCTETLLLDTDNLPGNCDSDILNLSGNITSNTYSADIIKSDGSLSNSVTVIFQSKNYTELMYDFDILKGADFEVHITGCN